MWSVTFNAIYGINFNRPIPHCTASEKGLKCVDKILNCHCVLNIFSLDFSRTEKGTIRTLKFNFDHWNSPCCLQRRDEIGLSNHSPVSSLVPCFLAASHTLTPPDYHCGLAPGPESEIIAGGAITNLATTPNIILSARGPIHVTSAGVRWPSPSSSSRNHPNQEKYFKARRHR